MQKLTIRTALLGCAIAAVLPLAPALAVQTQIGFEFSEDFEGYAPGPLELPYSYVPPTPTFRLTGGAVAIGTADLPSRSGSQVYVSTGMISLGQVPGSDDYFHAASVYVSGTAPVTFTALRLGGMASFTRISPSNARNHFFSFTASDLALPGDLPYITSILLSSPGAFAIDDIVIGEQTAAAPVPEPTGWAMLITGFGLIGSVARRRRLAL